MSSPPPLAVNFFLPLLCCSPVLFFLYHFFVFLRPFFLFSFLSCLAFPKGLACFGFSLSFLGLFLLGFLPPPTRFVFQSPTAALSGHKNISFILPELDRKKKVPNQKKKPTQTNPPPRFHFGVSFISTVYTRCSLFPHLRFFLIGLPPP